MKHFSLAALGLLIIIASCTNEESATEDQGPRGIDLTLMDTTTSPKEDFFRYVNGTWLDNTEIPADRGRWGSFDELRQRTNEDVLAILDKAGESDYVPESEDQRKAAVFYQTAMDTAHIDELGIQPMEPYLEKVEGVVDLASLQNYLIETEPYGGGGFVDFDVSPDLKNSNIYAAYLSPARLGLPDREYYLKTDAESQKIQEQYKEHLMRMFGFLNVEGDEAAKVADQIYDLEKRLAKSMLTKEERRNTPLLYNKRSIDDLSKHMPSFDWAKYFEGIGAGGLDTVILTQPKHLEALDKEIASTSPELWKNYLRWQMINGLANYLSSDIEKADFEFYGKILQGTPEMRPRWERVLGTTNNVVGEALGQLYVSEYFPPEAKADAEELVANILKAFEGRIKNLTWMTPETKEKALEKLSSFNVKIAYPDEWEDYSKLVVKSSEEGGSYMENLMHAQRFNYYKELERLGKEVDRSEWFMAPQVVNAYYYPPFNEIVFPAAILQPPFYDYRADAAVNYGGIGAVIGHEISHGFDDSGSRFDAGGNLVNWWTDEDRENFEALNKKLIAQYDSYKPFEDLSVNGTYTLGENIGDLGGLNVAFDGLKMHWEEHGKPEPINGFTAEQRFFLSWGTIWRTKYRDEALRTQINTNSHAPGMYRAIGPPRNMDAFYEAFSIQDGDPAYVSPEERIKIW